MHYRDSWVLSRCCGWGRPGQVLACLWDIILTRYIKTGDFSNIVPESTWADTRCLAKVFFCVFGLIAANQPPKTATWWQQALEEWWFRIFGKKLAKNDQFKYSRCAYLKGLELTVPLKMWTKIHECAALQWQQLGCAFHFILFIPLWPLENAFSGGPFPSCVSSTEHYINPREGQPCIT